MEKEISLNGRIIFFKYLTNKKTSSLKKFFFDYKYELSGNYGRKTLFFLPQIM
jgi:hypothetical protein